MILAHGPPFLATDTDAILKSSRNGMKPWRTWTDFWQRSYLHDQKIFIFINKQGGHWDDSGFARAKLVSTDRLVVSG